MKHRGQAACALALSVGCAALAGCASDDLGKSFQPSDPDPQANLYGPLSPITAGTTLTYLVSATSDDDAVSSIGQQSASGYLCVKVDAVKDTATKTYKDAAQTLVTARVKVTGGAGVAEIVVVRVEDNGGQPNPVPGDPAEVEALLEPLWLKHLTVPLRGHGYAQPASRDFPTRHSPRPAGATLDQALLQLPFFEVRGALDQSWCGWDSSPEGWPEEYPPGTETPCYNAAQGSVYFLSNFTRYFADYRACTPPYGSADTRCEYATVTPPADCATRAQPDCNGGCVWDSTEGCLEALQVTMTWRGDVVATTHYPGDVLHQVRFHYDARGILRFAEEIMVPDASPATPVDAEIGGCGAGYCAQARVELDPDVAWANSPCSF